MLLASKTLAATYRLGVPKGSISTTYSHLFKAITERGLVAGEDLQVVPIDLENFQTEAGKTRIREEIAKNCDLFFSVGNQLHILFAVEIKTPLLFFSTNNLPLKMPEAMRSNVTGFSRGDMSNLLNQMLQVLPANQRKKLVLLHFKDSTLGAVPSLMEEAGMEVGVTVEVKSYETKEDLGQVMSEFKRAGTNAVMLFPPSLREGDLGELINWQNRLGLPVISQVKEDIEQGALGGPTIDYNQLMPQLAEYAVAIFKGRSPSQLPVKFFRSKIVINLAAASALGIDIPKETTDEAELVGIPREVKGRKIDKKPLVPGNFVIGIPASMGGPALDSTILALSGLGYEEGKNLRLVRLDLEESDSQKQQEKILQTAAGTNLILATGNSLPILCGLHGLQTPVCFIATQETAALIEMSQRRNFTGVIRGSFDSLVEKSQRMLGGAKKIGMLARDESGLDRLLWEYRRIAEGRGVTIDYKLFATPSEIGPAMQSLQENNDFVLLFPPSITKEDLKEIVAWQNKLQFPVLGQHKDHIKAGLLGGPTVDLDMVALKAAEFIDKILQDRNPAQLPYYYCQERYIINLKTAALLKLEIPADITAEAEIVQ